MELSGISFYITLKLSHMAYDIFFLKENTEELVSQSLRRSFSFTGLNLANPANGVNSAVSDDQPMPTQCLTGV